VIPDACGAVVGHQAEIPAAADGHDSFLSWCPAKEIAERRRALRPLFAGGGP